MSIRIIKGSLENNFKKLTDKSINGIIGYHKINNVNLNVSKINDILIANKFKHEPKEYYFDADSDTEWAGVLEGLTNIRGRTIVDPCMMDMKLAYACQMKSVNYIGFAPSIDIKKVADEIISMLCKSVECEIRINSVSTYGDIIISRNTYH